MVREYERSADVTYPDDLKIATVVAALPPSLRVHIQMSLQDPTTFEEMRQKVELYEQVSTKWTADVSLQALGIRPSGSSGDDGSSPMEVSVV